MGSTANEDKRTYLSRQTTIDELQVKISALLNIEKVLKKKITEEISIC